MQLTPVSVLYDDYDSSVIQQLDSQFNNINTSNINDTTNINDTNSFKDIEMQISFLRDHLNSSYNNTVDSMNKQQNEFKFILEDVYNDLQNKYKELFNRFEKQAPQNNCNCSNEVMTCNSVHRHIKECHHCKILYNIIEKFNMESTTKGDKKLSPVNILIIVIIVVVIIVLFICIMMMFNNNSRGGR